MKTLSYLTYTSPIEDIAKSFGVEAVPVLFNGTFKDAEKYVKEHETDPIFNAPLEGVVGRPLVELKRCLMIRLQFHTV